jgi:hypothetical protein
MQEVCVLELPVPTLRNWSCQGNEKRLVKHIHRPKAEGFEPNKQMSGS